MISAVPYGDVVTVMVALQEAGAPSVGLVTEESPVNTSIYAKPVMPRIVVRPALVTLLLHGLLIYLLTVNWTSMDKRSHPGEASAAA